MKVITFANNGYKSVGYIVDRMNEEITIHRLRRGGNPHPDVDLLIRWGSRVHYPAKKTINRSGCIGRASAKAQARLDMMAAGVAVPKTALLTIGGDYEDFTYPVVVRPERHQGGKDFHLFEDHAALQAFVHDPRCKQCYVSEFYPKTQEYRVHTAHGRVLLVNRKVAPDGRRYDAYVWNHALNNFYFKVVRRRDWPTDVVRLGLDATAALGLDYAAVDILAGAPGLGPVVCEVNTAPSTENYTSQKYAIYFDWLVRTGGREEHFSLPAEDAGRGDYVFDYAIGR